ncbi:ferritin-like metal-binding protein YciE [Leucobacter luti]|uniref:Ferritin-like metal-binding protein YciE n=1 Tax=Leucobacter luti TaxID=340320 RepID=A0A4R6RX32_9MICO|nr:DUF892 family protein [Leucobacter luti]MCW2288367.1 ferritin-like metal-binding protein YciE [Leucobacter luti]TCK45476.1 ferritin-like metal-binding protein YciE [Leucobacter luti]TDP91619.1 ferritin-like metal-binding protein YciE [Leucobacter luti]
MAQQKLETPEELFHYQLRSARTMEQHSLESLDELHAAVSDTKLKKMFSHHADETREQIDHLEQVFALMGYDLTTAPSPATTGIKNQAAGILEKADSKLHNQIALVSALGNEHFEISAYTALIFQAQALGNADAAKLLTDNIDQEIHTSKELRSTLKEMLS